MPATTITVAVTELREGDVLPGPGGWTAAANAVMDGHACRLLVWHADDGGSAWRVWDDPTHTLTIEREGS